MKSTKDKDLPKVTVILPMRNSSSIVISALESIRIQKYPIEEIIFIDNTSTDQSVALVREYSKKHPNMNIHILENKKNLMVARSFNRGIRAARTAYVVLMHSDCRLATKNEIRILIDPMLKDPSVIATYGVIENPMYIWLEYTFWEKCLLVRDAGRVVPGLVGKIDCYYRRTLLKIGAYDEKGYDNYGGEDADIYMRLKKIGKIVPTRAKSLHLHYLYKDFSLLDLIKKKKATACTYGRLLRIRGLEIDFIGIVSHLIKPVLAIGSFIPGVQLAIIPALILFPFLYYQRMFTTRITLTDPRIVTLPLVGVFLVYYETYWIVQSFFQKIKR